MLSNHFSLSVPITAMALFQQLHPVAQRAVHAQAAPSGVSLHQFNVFTCLFPDIDANHMLLLWLAALAVLPLLEAVFVKYVLHRGGKIASTVCVVQLLFMSVNTHAARLLQYEHFTFYNMTQVLVLPGSPGEPWADIRPMLTDRRIDRSSNGAFIALAALTLVVVGVGFPGLFVAVYRRMPEARRVKFTYVTRNYSVWYWEAVVCLRKTLSVLVVAALFDAPMNQALLYVLVIQLYLALHYRLNPMRSTWLSRADRVSCLAAIGTGVALLVGAGFSDTPLTSPQLSSWWCSAAIVALQVLGLGGVTYCLGKERGAAAVTEVMGLIRQRMRKKRRSRRPGELEVTEEQLVEQLVANS
jgi:hypothetical protein